MDNMGELLVLMCPCLLLACCGVVVLSLTVLRFVVVVLWLLLVLRGEHSAVDVLNVCIKCRR